MKKELNKKELKQTSGGYSKSQLGALKALLSKAEAELNDIKKYKSHLVHPTVIIEVEKSIANLKAKIAEEESNLSA